jgi:predicted O-methyltransferase YrrM
MMGDTDKILTDLGKFVEKLSVHQRLLGTKIEELASHHKQLFDQQNRIYDQIDALFSIFSLVRPRFPLPTMRGWPVSPDFVKILISLVLELKPTCAVELGSGVSTIVSAYCLEKNEKGKLLSFDHDSEYSQKTLKNLKNHGLDSWATVRFSPLEKHVISGRDYLWYSIPPDNIPESIDFLVVDGPPVTTENEMIRYPAVPCFFERLSPNAVVLLDDAARPGEAEIVRRWIGECLCFESEYVDTEKGAVILRKR